jgi:hypothetical protein
MTPLPNDAESAALHAAVPYVEYVRRMTGLTGA